MPQQHLPISRPSTPSPIRYTIRGVIFDTDGRFLAAEFKKGSDGDHYVGLLGGGMGVNPHRADLDTLDAAVRKEIAEEARKNGKISIDDIQTHNLVYHAAPFMVVRNDIVTKIISTGIAVRMDLHQQLGTQESNLQNYVLGSFDYVHDLLGYGQQRKMMEHIRPRLIEGGLIRAPKTVVDLGRYAHRRSAPEENGAPKPATVIYPVFRR